MNLPNVNGVFCTRDASCDEVTKFIKLCKILGYDVQNAKADSKKRLVGMGVIQSP